MHVTAATMDPRLLLRLLRLRPQLRRLLLMVNVRIMMGGRILMETIVLGTRITMMKAAQIMAITGQTLEPVSLRARLAATAAVATMLTQTQILQAQPQPHLRPKPRPLEASAAASLARENATGQKDVDTMYFKDYASTLCQARSVSSGIIKEGSARRTDASGIRIQGFVPEGGIEAASKRVR